MGKIAFLFPGQGAQAVGMGKFLCEASPSAAVLFDKANDILGYDLKELCFNGPQERLNLTDVCQPAIYVVSLAAVEYYKEIDPEIVSACQTAVGLSLGEYTSLAFAGAFSFEDGLRLVQKRGQAMQAAADQSASSMVSILGLDREKVEALCLEAEKETGEILKPANYLCPGNIAVSGSKTACEKIVPMAEAAGAIKVVPLAVAGAFHTPFMAPAAAALKETLASVAINAPSLPVISNVDVKSHSDPEDIRQTLLKQLTSPVMMEDSLRQLVDDGFDEFHELGPGRVLRGLMKRINRKAKMAGLDNI